MADWPDTAITHQGHRVHGNTFLFGKHYFWMEDPEGTIYLARERDGIPSLS